MQSVGAVKGLLLSAPPYSKETELSRSTTPGLRILVACLADASGNPRPRRNAELCRDLGHDVTIAGFAMLENPDAIDCFVIPSLSGRMPARIFRSAIRVLSAMVPLAIVRNRADRYIYRLEGFETMLSQSHFDLIICEDLHLLPSIFRNRGKAEVIFDAREYYPAQNEDRRYFRLVERPTRVRVCAEFMPLCKYVLTVSNGLAQEYGRNFSVDPIVIRSVPVATLRQGYRTSTFPFRVVHHGAARRNRRIENMIEAVLAMKGGSTLDLYLVPGDSVYISELRRRYEAETRINFCKPMPFSRITEILSGYDIGLFYCEPSTFNLKHCLPNKFFEFIHARLAVAVGPTPDMADIVDQYGCGVVASEFSVEAMTAALEGISPELLGTYKERSDRACADLCWQEERKKLARLINSISGVGDSMPAVLH